MTPGQDAPPTATDLLLEMELVPGEASAAALIDALAAAAQRDSFSLDLDALQTALDSQGPAQFVLARARERLLLLTLQPVRDMRLALATWLPAAGHRVSLDIQLLQGVMDELPAAVTIKDADRRYRFVNRCWERSLAMQRKDVLGRRFEDLVGNCLLPEVFATVAAELRRSDQALIEGDEGESETEQAFFNAKGVARTMLVSKVPLRSSHDPRPGILSITVDITERKQVAQNLLVATAQLSERSTALAAARERAERARRDAEAAARTKARLLAMMSHELRTPMTGVLGMLDLMEDGGGETQVKDRLHALRALRGSAEALMRVLDDILDYSLIESGHFELRDAPFAPEALLREVAAQFAGLAAGQGLHLRVEVAPGLPPQAMGDAPRLRQVLGHLLSNAVKFTHSGGVTARLDTEAAADGTPLLVLRVLDTGPGIPPERRTELFQPFTPLEEVTLRRAGGTGLGLVVCKQLANSMCGDVACEDAPGGGAQFRFALPLRLPAPARVAPPDRLPPARVLVVDDVALNRKVVPAILERDEHRVVLAGTGDEAVARVAAGPPFDLVLMDLHMPGMDGIAATAAIRALPGAAARVPVHALTADVFARTSAEYAAAGFTGFLTKPLDWTAIRQAIAIAQAVAAEAPDGPPPAPVLDGEQLAGMFEGMPRDTVGQMYEEFLRSLREVLARLRLQRDQGDGPALAREVHSLKGLAGNFGAARLAQAAATLQARLGGGMAPAALTLAPLEAALGDTVDAIHAGTHLRLLDTAGAAPPRPR